MLDCSITGGVLVAGGPGKGGKVVPGVQGFQYKSRVVAEFVEEMPAYDSTEHLKPFEAQPGVREAMMKAMANPGRAMKLVEYCEGPRSKWKSMAKIRAKGLQERGYSEENGWDIRAVDNCEYVRYEGV